MTIKIFCRNPKRQTTNEVHLINFLDDMNLDYDIKPIQQITLNDLTQLLKYTYNGFPDLLSGRKQYGEVTTKELLMLIKMGKVKAKTPLAIQGEKTLIGYSEDEVGIFTPRNRRRQEALIYAEKAARLLGLDSEIESD